MSIDISSPPQFIGVTPSWIAFGVSPDFTSVFGVSLSLFFFQVIINKCNFHIFVCFDFPSSHDVFGCPVFVQCVWLSRLYAVYLVVPSLYGVHLFQVEGVDPI